MKRAQLKRHPERGTHDIDAIRAVVDEGLVCHVGVPTPHGPLVLPMAYGRIDNTIYFHGAIANGLMRAGTKAEDTHVCATITLLDGLVFARSHFNHSMNYRCVVAFGPLREVTSLDEKRAALVAVMNHAATDRARVSREPDENEMMITRVVALELTEASLKARTGPPMDGTFAENADYACWTGVIPLAIRAGVPITAETNADPDAPVPVLPRIASA